MPYLQPLGKLNSIGQTMTFSLPRGQTCPGAGACRWWCYANKGRFSFPTVADCHQRNLDLTRSGMFVATIVKELQAKRKLPAAIRIHSSGDFYDQAYLDRWCWIARVFPTVLFYCYTTSLHLNWSAWDALPNTNRVLSAGGSTTGTKLRAYARRVQRAVVHVVPDVPAHGLDGSHDDIVAARTNTYQDIYIKQH